MRQNPPPELEAARVNDMPAYRSPPGTMYGAFILGDLHIISSGSYRASPWEHVSVSRVDRCPNWDEMARIKDLFWRDDETVVQFHPRADQYVNRHPYCLHLWRHRQREYELPPGELIG